MGSQSFRTSGSSLRRAKSLALAALALGGCMKIYPDPELPDIEVTWFESDCREGADVVALSLIGFDDTSFRSDVTVACSDAKKTFADVARERYRFEAELRSATGEMLSSYNEDLDLRNGLDRELSLYFGGFENVRVAWTFDMGAMCASLAVDNVMIEFTDASFAEPFAFAAPCELAVLFTSVPDGIYTVVARAVSGGSTVAVSLPSPAVSISFESFTDIGTLVMTPCGSSCP